MEEIAEGFIKTIGSILRWLVIDLVVGIVLFNLGRLFLLIVTLGKYPRGNKLEHDETFIIITGTGVLVSAWLLIVIYNRWHF